MMSFRLLIITTLLLSLSLTKSQPNIVFIWFDDLGFADVGYNGGTAPTPILDRLSSSAAIKLNFHYTESMCTPSRSAFYTGRYSFKAGVNIPEHSFSQSYIDRNLVFFSQLLQQNSYKSFIAGKWHIGYKYKDTLPGHRGYDEGRYSHLNGAYYTRQFVLKFDNLDQQFPTNKNKIKTKRDNLFGDRIDTHDFWTINARNGDDVAAFINDKTYIETLSTEGIIDFMDRQTNANPFFVHYNVFTPHSPLQEPPNLKATSTSDYSICSGIGLNANKELFCRTMLYAQDCIEAIIQKTKDMGFYDNTIFVITSDQGPEPGNGKNKVSEGQTLPLRGSKGGLMDGSLRSAAFMMGGYIENNVLNGMNQCEYNEMVHVSDWYNIFTEIAGISHSNSDADHSNLQIWDDIKCKCDSSCINTVNDNANTRDELMIMRVCGDDYSTGYGDNYIHSGMIIKDGYKLIVNASMWWSRDCGAGSTQYPNSESILYDGADNKVFNTPNQQYFDDWYKPQIDAGRGNLYQSQCLDNLDGTADINNPNYIQFVPTYLPQYPDTEMWLFNIETDKVEACNIASQQETKVLELLEILKNRMTEYDVPPVIPTSVGGMWSFANSYSCQYDKAFLVPWDGNNEDKCLKKGDVVQSTMNDYSARECATIWKKLSSKKAKCNVADYDDHEMNVVKLINVNIGSSLKSTKTIISMIGLLILILGVIYYYYFKWNRNGGKYISINDPHII